MEMYFNNANGHSYKIIARYNDDVMLLETEDKNYIVALWIDHNTATWGSGHYWMSNFELAKQDFCEMVCGHICNPEIGVTRVKAMYNF